MRARLSLAAPWMAFLAVLLGVSAANVSSPEWNFDVIPYVALVEGLSSDDTEAVHRATYDTVEQAAPEVNFKRLTRGSIYRKSLHENPENLALQARLFGNKPGYVGAIALVSALGLNTAHATYVVSSLCLFAFAVGLRIWLGSVTSPWLATAVGSCLVLAAPLRLAGKASSPDMLATLILVPALVSCTRGERVPLGMLGVGVAIAVRPDVVIAVPLLLGWALLRRPEGLSVGRTLAAAAAALGVYAAISATTSGFPYLVFLRHALVQTIFEVGQPTEAITVAEYLEGFVRGVFGTGYTKYPSSIPLFLLVTVLALWLDPDPSEPSPWRDLMLLGWVYVAAHIVLFPVLADRYFLPQMVFCVLALVRVLPTIRGGGGLSG